MLRELSVQNLALIEDVHVELEEGYCAWTGETGAGKSLLLTALGLVAGGKASADLIRSGKSEAARPLSSISTIRSSGPRSKKRSGARLMTISSSSRADCHLKGGVEPKSTGCRSPSSTLQKLGERLVDIHGQLEGRALLDPDQQRDLLDAYGGLDELLRKYRDARQAHETLRQEAEALLESEATRQRERALLEFERDELAGADPRAGECDKLSREAHRLQKCRADPHGCIRGLCSLVRGRPVGPRLVDSHRADTRAADKGTRRDCRGGIHTRATRRRNARSRVQSPRRRQGWDDDPERLEEVEARMAVYRRLAGRFHCTVDELADRRAAIEAKLEALDRDDADLLVMDKPLAVAWTRLEAGCERADGCANEARQRLREGDSEADEAVGTGGCAALSRD